MTHVTFELGAMSFAIMKPRKVDVRLAVPPLKREDVPFALQDDWLSKSEADVISTSAIEEFESRAANDYYSEWFWCPYQEKSWVQSWNCTNDPAHATDYPDAGLTFLQWLQGWIAGIFTESPFFNALPGYWQAQLLATAQMAILPPTFGESDTPTIKTGLPNALHFRRGVQNMRVRNMEFLVPLPGRADDPKRPDFRIVRQLWWDTIQLVYSSRKSAFDPSSPMRLLLEMRLIGNSDMILSPQYGNSLGTLSIEVLSVPDSVADDEWQGFLQQVADKWMETATGLNVRPHLAKEWDGLQLGGLDARTYLKTKGMAEQLRLFKEQLQAIGNEQGWTLEDLKKSFSNELWDILVFS